MDIEYGIGGLFGRNRWSTNRQRKPRLGGFQIPIYWMDTFDSL
jgi:hypothetical protein